MPLHLVEVDDNNSWIGTIQGRNYLEAALIGCGSDFRSRLLDVARCKLRRRDRKCSDAQASKNAPVPDATHTVLSALERARAAAGRLQCRRGSSRTPRPKRSP